MTRVQKLEERREDALTLRLLVQLHFLSINQTTHDDARDVTHTRQVLFVWTELTEEERRTLCDYRLPVCLFDGLSPKLVIKLQMHFQEIYNVEGLDVLYGLKKVITFRW